MKLDRVLKSAGLAAFMAWLVCGCTGINTSQSVSPATFLLPGLIQNAPAPAAPQDSLAHSTPSGTFAQIRP